MELVKWYLDVAAPDGRCAIVYAARLRLLGSTLALQGLLLHDGKRTRTRWNVLPAPSPRREGGRIRFRSVPLGLSVDVEPLDPPFTARLLERPAGLVDWECHVPRGRVRMRIGGEAIDGLGYVERLRLTLPPWELPIQELRWGRMLSAAGSATWIDWRGPSPLCLALRDGRRLAAGAVSDRVVEAGDPIRLAPVATLREARLSRTLPLALRRALPRAGLGLQETKWLSRGTLAGAPGIAIHEVVRWP